MAPDIIALVASRIGEPVHVNWPEHLFHCPFCEKRMGTEDRKGHMYVHEENGYFCHRCEARGRIAWLLKVLGISEEEMQGPAPGDDVDIVRDLSLLSPTTTTDIAVESVFLPDNVDYVWNVPPVWYYANQRRGLSVFDCQHYGLLAWLDEYGHYRLLFPDYFGKKLVYWTARAVDDDVHPKYVCAEDSEKSLCVWNVENIRPDWPAYVAEGVMSARACGSNGMAIYGKYLSDAQLSLISRRVGKYGVRIVLDSGARKNALAIANKFMRYSLSGMPPVPCGVVFLPGEKTDPDDLPHVQLQDLLLSCGTLDEVMLDRLVGGIE
jgi:hypothetical protein